MRLCVPCVPDPHVHAGHGAGGTDNHLFLWDLRPHELTGTKMERACDLAGITLNKNTVFGDKSALTPGQITLAANT